MMISQVIWSFSSTDNEFGLKKKTNQDSRKLSRLFCPGLSNILSSNFNNSFLVGYLIALYCPRLLIVKFNQYISLNPISVS